MSAVNRFILGVFVFCGVLGAWFVYSEIHSAEAQKHVEQIQFTIEKGESVSALADKLEREQVIRSATMFKKFLRYKKLDTAIRAGTFTVEAPITLARVVASLQQPSFEERTITLIPGWHLGDMAAYFEAEGIATEAEFFALAGSVAQRGRPSFSPSSNIEILKDKPKDISLEGYIRPDTFRIFSDASLEEIVEKLVRSMDSLVTEEMYADIKKSGRTVHEVMTIASLLEREVRGAEDRARVADIFWRRYDINWALQADSTVHYITGTDGSVFTSAADRESLNPWNTYKYPGLPPGPIAAPSFESINAAIYPKSNNDWYFLTDLEGNVHYGASLEEHNANVYRYLR